VRATRLRNPAEAQLRGRLHGARRPIALHARLGALRGCRRARGSRRHRRSVRPRQRRAQLQALKPLFEAKAVSQKEYDRRGLRGRGRRIGPEEREGAPLRSAALARPTPRWSRRSPGFTSRALKSEGSLIAGPQDLLTTVDAGRSDLRELRLVRERAGAPQARRGGRQAHAPEGRALRAERQVRGTGASTPATASSSSATCA